MDLTVVAIFRYVALALSTSMFICAISRPHPCSPRTTPLQTRAGNKKLLTRKIRLNFLFVYEISPKKWCSIGGSILLISPIYKIEETHISGK